MVNQSENFNIFNKSLFILKRSWLKSKKLEETFFKIFRSIFTFT